MAKKKKAQSETATKVYESPEALQDSIGKSQQFFEKNRNILAGLLTVLVLVLGGFFWYQWYNNRQNQVAHEQLFPAEFYFQKDSLEKALYGDGNYTDGFLSISDEYSSTPAGNLATFYAGVSFVKLGDYQKAIEQLEDFSSDDYLIQARAYALVGDSYMELEQYQEAIKYYDYAAGYKPNGQFTPSYLIKLALAHEKAGETEDAANAYQQIVDEYGDSDEVRTAKKYLSRLKAMQ